MKKLKLLIVFLVASTAICAAGCNDMQNEKQTEDQQIILRRGIEERNVNDCEDDDCEKDNRDEFNPDYKFVEPERRHVPPHMPHKHRNLPAPPVAR